MLKVLSLKGIINGKQSRGFEMTIKIRLKMNT